MNHIAEAMKFIWRAHDAVDRHEITAHLKMAEWCLSRATKDRDDELKLTSPI